MFMVLFVIASAVWALEPSRESLGHAVDGHVLGLAWSPDGRSLAVEVPPENDTSAVMLFTGAGAGEVVEVPVRGSGTLRPVWLGADSVIVEGPDGLFSYQVGAQVEPLITDRERAGAIGSMTVSADGTAAAFVR